MARYALVLVLCQIFTLPFLTQSNDNDPLMDLAGSFLQNVVGNFVQGDAGKNIGSLFGQDGSGAADMLSGNILLFLFSIIYLIHETVVAQHRVVNAIVMCSIPTLVLSKFYFSFW